MSAKFADEERATLTKLTVAIIKSNLASFGVTDVKRMHKAELTELLLSEMESQLKMTIQSTVDQSNHVARRACKLRYIVGGAPVCYGVPVFSQTAS